MKSLKGKIVVITGAGSGIGRALALQCAAAGAKLGLCDVDLLSLQSTVWDAQILGAEVVQVQADVGRLEDLEDFAERMAQAYGSIDILINNAGVALAEYAVLTKRPDFEWLFNINFWGVINSCEAFMPLLLKSPQARIVNMSSVFGLFGVPGMSAYCASKFAILGYSDSLRGELRDTNVGMSVVLPGGIDTNIARNGRLYRGLSGDRISSKEFVDSFAKVARTSPERAAEIILLGVLKQKDKILVGRDALVLVFLTRFFPGFLSRMTRFAASKLKKRSNALNRAERLKSAN